MRTILLLLITACIAARAATIAVPPERANELQAAFTESGRTGATVELAGIYVVTNQLVTSGARIRGSLGSHHGDWNVGSAVIHFRGVSLTNGCLRVTQGPSGNPTVIEHLAMVCYHQSTPESVGVAADGASYGSVLSGVLIDRAGIGIVLEPSPRGLPRSLGHRFHDITVQSFRTAAIQAPDPVATSDHYWTGLTYLKGHQGPDYVAGATTPTTSPIGIDGYPSSTVMDNLLVESCSTSIVLRRPINGRIKDMFADDVRGVVFRRWDVWSGRHYIRTLRIGLLTAQAGAPKCLLAVGNPSQEIQVGMQTLSTCRDGASWANWVPPRR